MLYYCLGGDHPVVLCANRSGSGRVHTDTKSHNIFCYTKSHNMLFYCLEGDHPVV